jgi:hypothetical protein
MAVAVEVAVAGLVSCCCSCVGLVVTGGGAVGVLVVWTGGLQANQKCGALGVQAGTASQHAACMGTWKLQQQQLQLQPL